ncbi:HTH 29 domain containing protein, partial [Asbolus verrucosus]
FPNDIVDYAHFCNTLNRCVAQFRETSSLRRKEGSGRTKDKRTPEKIENVRQLMDENPRTSIRHLAQQVDLSYGTCQKILKKHFILIA